MDYDYSQYCIDGPLVTLGTDIEKKFTNPRLERYHIGAN